MSTREVLCPSGLRIAVRGMKIKEMNALADAANMRRGTAMDGLLKACTTDVLDVGPYPFDGGSEVPWGEVLTGDRFSALMGIRIHSLGAEYDFELQCTSRTCGETFEWSIDLEKDLETKVYDELALVAFFAKKTFPVTLPDGRAAEMRFLVGNDEKTLNKGRRDKLLSDALAKRIVTVGDIHPNDRVRYIENLAIKDAAAVLAALDAYDGGIETEIEVECPSCGRRQPADLPFDKGFWMPDPKRTPRAS